MQHEKWYDISDKRMEFGSLYYMNIKMLYLGTFTRIIYIYEIYQWQNYENF